MLTRIAKQLHLVLALSVLALMLVPTTSSYHEVVVQLERGILVTMLLAIYFKKA